MPHFKFEFHYEYVNKYSLLKYVYMKSYVCFSLGLHMEPPRYEVVTATFNTGVPSSKRNSRKPALNVGGQVTRVITFIPLQVVRSDRCQWPSYFILKQAQRERGGEQREARFGMECKRVE